MKDFNGKNTILFDMDGVVVDSGNTWRDVGVELLARRDKVFDHKKVRPLMAGKSGIDAMKVLAEIYNLDEDLEALAEERRELVKEVYAREVSYIPGFKEFFDRVTSASYKIALATACDPDLMKVLEAKIKLSEFFGDHVYMIADVGYKSKPDPAIFLYAAEKVGATPEESYVIEDSPHGIEAAANAGMFGIALVGDFAEESLVSAKIVTHNYNEISNFLKL